MFQLFAWRRIKKKLPRERGSCNYRYVVSGVIFIDLFGG